MNSSTNSTYSTSLPSEQTETAPNQSDGVLSNVKQQINSVSEGASQISSQVTAIAGEKVNGVKDTVVPAAGEALHNIQDQIQSLAGGATGADASDQGTCVKELLCGRELTRVVTDTNPAADAEDQKRVDQMSTEQVCDFLRAKHLSNRPPPSTN